jgi:hypothetical protein
VFCHACRRNAFGDGVGSAKTVSLLAALFAERKAYLIGEQHLRSHVTKLSEENWRRRVGTVQIMYFARKEKAEPRADIIRSKC